MPAASIEVTIASSGQLIPLPSTAPIATFTYTINGGASIGPLSVQYPIDIASNVRLIFGAGLVNPSFVAGDKFSFSVGVNTKVADKTRSNIYVQYDYMDWADASPPLSCTMSVDCFALGGEHRNESCVGSTCKHNHLPADPTFRRVVKAFDTKSITLYIDPVHNAVPHAKVVTFAKPGDLLSGPGALAACAGVDVVPGNIGPGIEAVNFHDIKNRLTYGGPFDPRRKNVFRYALFAHYNTCDSDVDCANCPLDRSTPAGQPIPNGGTGVAELPGNDLIVSPASIFNDPSAPYVQVAMNEGGLFMHELGHTLGLSHAGDGPPPGYKPNYLSVMNYRYVFTGISRSDTEGSTTPNPALRRLDYSADKLRDLDENNLNEALGVSDIGSGIKEIISFNNAYGTASGSGAGKINWNGDPPDDEASVAIDINGDGMPDANATGYQDWPNGFCATNADCPSNYVLTQINGVPTNQDCVQGRCVPMIFTFQCTQWGMADGPAPPEHLPHCASPKESQGTLNLFQ